MTCYGCSLVLGIHCEECKEGWSRGLSIFSPGGRVVRKVLSNCRFSLMISSSRLNGTSVSVFLEEAASLIEMPTLSKNVYPMNGVFLPSNSFLPTPLVALDGKASTGIDISSSSSCTEKLEVSSGEANTGLNGGVADNPNKEISRFQSRGASPIMLTQ